MRARIARFAAAAALLAACAAPAAARARLPGVLWHDGGRGDAFLVRPSSIYTTEDGSGVEGVLHRGGAEVEHGPGRGFLRWRSWTSRRAEGIGTGWLKLGTPASTSPFTRAPVTLTLYRVRSGHFTRMRISSRSHPRFGPATLCLSAPFRGSYRWDDSFGGRCQ